MKRILIYLFGGLAALLVLLVLAVLFVPSTPVGRGLIDDVSRPIIENVVAERLGGTIEYDAIEGALPNELILRNVRVHDTEGLWLTVGEASLKWRPMAFIGGTISVENITLEGIDLLRQPILPDQGAEGENDEGGNDQASGNPLAFILDDLAIRSLTIHEPVLGQRYELDIGAAAEWTRGSRRLIGTLTTEGETDSVSVRLIQSRNMLEGRVSVTSAEDGLIPTLLAAGGPIFVDLQGTGPLEDWAGQLRADLAGFGQANGRVSVDIATLSRGSGRLSVVPGPLLGDEARSLVGDEAILDIQLSQQQEELTLAFGLFEAALGQLSGTMSATATDFSEIDLDINGTFLTEALAPFGAETLAGPFIIGAQIYQQNDEYIGSANAELPVGILALNNISVGEDIYSADVSALPASSWFQELVGDARLAALIANGQPISATVSLADNQILSVSNLSASLGDAEMGRLRLSGGGGLDLGTSQLNAALEGSAGPVWLANWAGYDGALAPAALNIRATGTLDSITTELNADIPVTDAFAAPFEGGRLVGTIAGLPATPTGELVFTGTDNAVRSRVSFAMSDETVLVDQLELIAEGLTIQGTASAALATGTATSTLTIDAAPETQLFTGQTVGGRIELTATAGDGFETLTAALTGNSITLDDNAIGTLTANVQGAPTDLTFRAEAGSLFLGDTGLSTVSLAGRFTQDEAMRVQLDQLAAYRTGDNGTPLVQLLSPAIISMGERTTLAPVEIAIEEEGRLRLAADASASRWTASIDLQDLPLPDTEYMAGATLTLDTDRPLKADGQITVTPLDASETPARLLATLNWDGTTARLDAQLADDHSNEGTPLATAEAAIPLPLTRGANGTLSAAFDPNAPLSLVAEIAAPLDTLLALVPDAPVYGQGMLEGSVTADGPVGAFNGEGSLQLTDGRLEDDTVGLLLRNVTLNSAFAFSPTDVTGDVSLTSTGARGGDPRIILEGNLSPSPDGGAAIIDGTVDFDRATLANTAQLELITDGTLSLSGPLTDLLLQGALTIEELDAQIPSTSGNGGSGAATAENIVPIIIEWEGDTPDYLLAEEAADTPPAPTMTLDLTIEADNQLFIRGQGLDSEWTADLTVTGEASAPIVRGTVAARSGRFDFAGRSFDITSAEALFDGTDAADPRVNAEASYDAGDVVATIGVSGKASSPSISLSSDPALPEEDVMAYILFGKQPTDLSALESLQLANAVATLSGASPLGGNGGGVTNALRAGTGLDALSLGIDPTTGEAGVTVGKYVSDDIYVSAKQSAGESGTEITVTYEVTDRITLETALKPSGAQSASANFKRDY